MRTDAHPRSHMHTGSSAPCLPLSGRARSQSLTDAADREIVSLYHAYCEETTPGWSLIALGGYGRNDLCPYSDLDLLLLVGRRTSRKEVAAVIGDILYPLWDKGYTASYSVRTAKQSVHDARADFFFRTSLIDARFICGSPPLFEELMHAAEKDRRLTNTRIFVSDLVSHTHRRHSQFGDTSYILEPELKQGHGGLRDFHTVMWTLKVIAQGKRGLPPGLITQSDIRELAAAYDCILNIRFSLHEVAGRKNDRMYLEFQEILAEKMGFAGSDIETSVETFMKHFHTQALKIKSVTDSVVCSLAHELRLNARPARRVIDDHFEITAGQLSFTNPGEVPEEPSHIMTAFEHMGTCDCTLSPSARSLIRDSLHRAHGLRQSGKAHETFLRILSSKNPKRALTCMLELGLIETFIPEFETLRGRTIFDLYHTYTVDLHSIQTVAELRDLQDSLPEIFDRVQDKNALYLSAFLHDIGKGYGHRHEIVGVDIAARIAGRFDMSGEGVDHVCFLIRNHLVLADLATKRDLSEERIAVEFALMMKNPQRLSMLYLLTVADSKATGPLAWNDWKESLTGELYAKALHVMEHGMFKNPDDTARFENKWQDLLSELPPETGEKNSSSLWALPQAYIHLSETADIIRHMDLRKHIHGPEDIEVDVTHKGSHVRLTIITQDRPGLFSLLTGILSLSHLEIVSAQVFTWHDSVAVDVFTVTPPWKDFSQWHAIANQFKSAVSGNLDVDARLALTKAPMDACQGVIHTARQASVGIDNETSDFFTLIEIRARNYPGMLQRVARALTSFGLDIHRAFVSRNDDLVTDVFYVVDALGEKIEDEQVRQMITEGITRVIADTCNRG